MAARGRMAPVTPIAAHLRGGASDGRTVPLPDRRPVREMPLFVDPLAESDPTTPWLARDVYLRRDAHLHPASFVSRTGGPDAGHWIYDEETLPRARLWAGTQIVAREVIEDLGWWVVGMLGDRAGKDAAREGLSIDRHDAVWSARTLTESEGGWCAGDVEVALVIVAQSSGLPAGGEAKRGDEYA